MLINLLKRTNKKIIPIIASFVEKRDDIDWSTIYSFEYPSQLLHADFGNLEFPGKFTTDSKYWLLSVSLFTSKIYVYPMKPRKLIAKEAFAAEQKFRELKKRIYRLKSLEIKLSGNKRTKPLRMLQKLLKI